jgi:hypothetical protein
LEIEKPPPYVGDIWVPTLLINYNGSVKILTPGLETWFQLGDRLIRIEHVNVTSQLLSWMLEINENGLHW